MVYKQVPRGYRAQEHPLPHSFGYGFSLGVESQSATIMSFFRADETITAVEGIEVNPSNAAFAEETGPTIANGSIIPKLTVSIHMSLAAVFSALQPRANVIVKMMPIYTAFLDSLEAENTRDAVQIEDVLELVHDTTDKNVQPLWDTVNAFTADNHPLNSVLKTEVFGDWGLTASSPIENVAFDPDLYFETLRFGTNAGMLKKVTGPIKTFHLSAARKSADTFFSSNFTQPMVKRGNPFTYCGLLCWLPQVASAVGVTQYGIPSEYTDIAHVHFNSKVLFDEWNPDFDQTSF